MVGQERVYRGRRSEEGEVSVTADGHELALRLDLHNHSPTGFEWSYNGSGPAQLALALLADALGDGGRALELYQEFKAERIATLEGDSWEMRRSEILAWVQDRLGDAFLDEREGPYPPPGYPQDGWWNKWTRLESAPGPECSELCGCCAGAGEKEGDRCRCCDGKGWVEPGLRASLRRRP